MELDNFGINELVVYYFYKPCSDLTDRSPFWRRTCNCRCCDTSHCVTAPSSISSSSRTASASNSSETMETGVANRLALASRTSFPSDNANLFALASPCTLR
eukprot:Trichotokara_eunicae@DN3356_c0_g1_i1.p1